MRTERKWKFEPFILARMVQAKREANTLTLRDVAEVTGVAPSTILRMEKGKRADIDSIVAVCEWLDLALDGFVCKKGGERG